MAVSLLRVLAGGSPGCCAAGQCCNGAAMGACRGAGAAIDTLDDAERPGGGDRLHAQ